MRGPADSRHPAIGYLLAESQRGSGRFDVTCSGTLIAPRVVLTAAHCVVQAPYVGTEVRMGFEPVRRPSDTTYRVSYVAVNPRYEGGFGDHDVALLLLESTPPVAPMGLSNDPAHALHLARCSFPTSCEEEPSECQLLSFGYGRYSADDPDSTGTKRRANGCWSPLDDNEFWLDQGSCGHICKADSGGPVLPSLSCGFASGQRITGVNSYTHGLECEGSTGIASVMPGTQNRNFIDNLVPMLTAGGHSVCGEDGQVHPSAALAHATEVEIMLEVPGRDVAGCHRQELPVYSNRIPFNCFRRPDHSVACAH